MNYGTYVFGLHPLVGALDKNPLFTMHDSIVKDARETSLYDFAECV